MAHTSRVPPFFLATAPSQEHAFCGTIPLAERKSEQLNMKRATNFVLIGPLLIWLTFLALLSPKIAVRGFTGAEEFFLIALLVCYAPGIIPLLAVAGVDELMARYLVNVWLRTLVCAGIGFAVAYALFWYGSEAVGAQRDFAQYGMWTGLLGGVPAAICSWLSSRNKTEELKA
jgi:hypothetical protein